MVCTTKQDRVEKPPVTELKITTPVSAKKRKQSDICDTTQDSTARKKGIKCTLYDARAEHARKTYSNTALNEFLSAVSSIDQQIHATAVLNVDETRVTDTQYGKCQLAPC